MEGPEEDALIAALSVLRFCSWPLGEEAGHDHDAGRPHDPLPR